ncbi:MAG: tetratricopeptide repeat protein [Planctomycetaceae bacterium]
MSENTPQIRVKSGIPWYIWFLLILVGGGVLAATVVSLTPVDPEQTYQDAMAAYDVKDAKAFKALLATLKTQEGYESHVQLLEALDLLGNSRPLKAVPVFAEAAKNESIRTLALSYQAQAMARGDQRKEAIGVLRQAIQNDPDDKMPHGILGGILYEIGAYTEALQELAVTTEHGTDKEAASAHNLRGNMLLELGRGEEAAADFEAALSRDPRNVANGYIALRMLQSLNQAGQFSKTLEMIDAADQSAKKEAIRAEALLETGDVTAALKVIEDTNMAEARDSSTIEIEAKILASGKVDQSEVEIKLPKLRESMIRMSRNARYFGYMAEALKLTGHEEEANLYLQNHEQLVDREKQYHELRDQVIDTVEDVESRLNLGRLAAACGHFEESQFWLTTAKRIEPERTGEVARLQNELLRLLPELVSLGSFRVLPENVSSTPPTDIPPIDPTKIDTDPEKHRDTKKATDQTNSDTGAAASDSPADPSTKKE